MVKVENKETLRLLTRRFMKMNRARNVIAVIAIMLTSLLFTSLFVGSVSMILSKRATEIKQFMPILFTAMPCEVAESHMITVF